jgi:hypothetical protein
LRGLRKKKRQEGLKNSPHFEPVGSRNSITTEGIDFQSVEDPVPGLISDCAYGFGDGQTPSMIVSKLMVVALASWINRQREHVGED